MRPLDKLVFPKHMRVGVSTTYHWEAAKVEVQRMRAHFFNLEAIFTPTCVFPAPQGKIRSPGGVTGYINLNLPEWASPLQNKRSEAFF